MSDVYSKIITEHFEKEQPDLAASIKLAVAKRETKANFIRFVKSMFPDFETSLIAQACITMFDYYKGLDTKQK